MKDIYQVTQAHQSIRKYKDSPVKEEDLKKILEAAIHGPSSINGQQWSVIVIKDPETKGKIAELAGGQTWIANCPVFLLYVMDYNIINKKMEKAGLEFANAESIEATMVGSVDCGIAFSNSMNVAEAMGYGIVPIGAVRREPYELIKLLNLPKYVYPVVGMCIGVPDEDPGLKPRMPYEAVVHEEKYNDNLDEVISEYDKTVEKYMNDRTGGKDVHSWSQGVGAIYSRVYFPKVKGSLEQQGFTNEK